jgi:hypothetical protein
MPISVRIKVAPKAGKSWHLKLWQTGEAAPSANKKVKYAMHSSDQEALERAWRGNSAMPIVS